MKCLSVVTKMKHETSIEYTVLINTARMHKLLMLHMYSK